MQDARIDQSTRRLLATPNVTESLIPERLLDMAPHTFQGNELASFRNYLTTGEYSGSFLSHLQQGQQWRVGDVLCPADTGHQHGHDHVHTTAAIHRDTGTSLVRINNIADSAVLSGVTAAVEDDAFDPNIRVEGTYAEHGTMHNLPGGYVWCASEP